MLHRKTVRDGALLIAAIFAAGIFLLAFDLSGNLSDDQRIELVELIILGFLFVVALGFFTWRRMIEQEREISLRTQAESHARFLAHHDHLTGLPNRRQLQQALDAAVAVPPSAESVHAILLLDLNRFKRINDVFGHPRGDEVLSTAARRMEGALRDGDLLARTGGDEFAVVVRNVAGPEGAANVANRILGLFESPISIETDTHHVGVGIGIALTPRDGCEASDLLRKADMALYKAKATGDLCFAFFQEEMDKEAHERDFIQRELALAIATGSIVPFYQPVVDLKSGSVRAFEALARWSHPTLGEISPERFIPIAEDSGLIRKLTEQILQAACTDARRWPSHVGVSVNISPLLLKDSTFALQVMEIIRNSGLISSRLELEITESAIVRDFEAARESLGALRDAGIRIALDDFGTGATSLFHLRSFKFDTIKIDRSFIDHMATESESASIVKAIVGLAKGLGVEIIAEGVEDLTQSIALQHEGCIEGQGFLFSDAMPASATLDFLNDTKPRLQIVG